MTTLFKMQENALKTFKEQTLLIAEQVAEILKSESDRIKLVVDSLVVDTEAWGFACDAMINIKYQSCFIIDQISRAKNAESYIYLHKSILNAQYLLEKASEIK